MSSEIAFPEIEVTTKPKDRDKTAARRLPPYHVILENDDRHTMDFVVDVLRKVLGCTLERAMQLMFQAHNSGRAAIWTGPKEIAELKVEQIGTFHEIHPLDGGQLGPLGCYIEPAPGG